MKPNNYKVDKSALVECYHCGESCKAETIHFDEKSFCCEGCKLVYDILKENNAYMNLVKKCISIFCLLTILTILVYQIFQNMDADVSTSLASLVSLKTPASSPMTDLRSVKVAPFGCGPNADVMSPRQASLAWTPLLQTSFADRRTVALGSTSSFLHSMVILLFNFLE